MRARLHLSPVNARAPPISAATSSSDDDIDVYDINDVLWAMCGRADSVDATEIIRRCWNGPLDPIIPKNRKGFQLAHDHRCMPAFRMDGKLPARRRNRRGVSEEFNEEVEEGTV